MRRYDPTLHIVCRVLYRRKFIDVMTMGEHDDSARMLPGAPPDTSASFCDPLDLTAALSLFPLFIVVLYKAIGSLIRKCADSPRLERMSFPEKHLGIFMGFCLIIAGKVQVDIRLLVSLESKESLKGNVKSGFYERLAAYGACLVRHVKSTAAGICPHFV